MYWPVYQGSLGLQLQAWQASAVEPLLLILRRLVILDSYSAKLPSFGMLSYVIT